MILPQLIWGDFQAEQMPPQEMDVLWAEGWRHFGPQFFRYNITEVSEAFQIVVPLRVELSQFALSKSQRRVLRKNEDLTVKIAPAEISDDLREMFGRHKERFTDNVPEEITQFLSPTPATVPCECLAVRCLLDGRCIAASFMDVGISSVSSVYAIFDPSHAPRSLGIFTQLEELRWARENGKQFAYLGYATLGSSHYDYKKQFSGLQGYDWASGHWVPWVGLKAAAQSTQAQFML